MRNLRRAIFPIAVSALVSLGALGASSAAAAPSLNLDLHHNPTNFAPGGSPGTLSATTAADGSADANEVQEIRVVADAGSLVLAFEGENTPELAFDASAVQVRDALRALPSIAGPNVFVALASEGSSRTYKVTFGGTLAKVDVPQITAVEGSVPLALQAAEYWFDVNNVGDTATAGTIELIMQLPAGIVFRELVPGSGGGESTWSCPGALPGDQTVKCTTPGPITRHNLNRNLKLGVDVDLGASGVLTASAEVKGGGAANPATATEPAQISSGPASFGILAPSFTPGFFTADGMTAVHESGAHPALFTVPFDLASALNANGTPVPAEDLRDVHVDLPPGFLGNPTAVGECSQATFTIGACPGSTQVGRIDARLTQLPTKLTVGIYNLSHPRGAVTDLGLVIAGNPVHIKASLDPANNYAIRTAVENVNQTDPPFSQMATLWGVPADPSHDSERCDPFKTSFPVDPGVKDTSKECSTDHERKPFLTVPSQCSEDNVFRLHGYDSWQNTGDFGPEIDYTLPYHQTECEVPRFEPSVELTPTGRQANTPTGLDVHIQIAQNENPNALATPPVKSTVVTLPKGMTVSPSFADGLVGCAESEIGLGTDRPVACPDSSRIGEVNLTSPLLPKPIEGSMYLAEQEDNPFGSLLALYLAMHDTEERGILVKVAGKISLDPITGQITQTFDDLPQFPFDDLTLKFRSGDRSPLVNPPTCGTHTIAVKMASYAQPANPVDVSNTYEVREGAGGSPCIDDASRRPFAPQLLGGTLNPVAGAFSPLALRVSRTDAEQELSTVQGTAPAGLSASLRGVGRCPEAQIALASARNRPGLGALEIASPSCPLSSQVGTLQAGAGAGPAPIYVPGRIYLAGPYRGAPLSGVAIVPAVAGPVDLGVVVVRAPAYVDPRTAQVRIVSDPLPQVINGVLIRVRDVRVNLNRSGFTLNPTSCAEKSLEATLTSTEGAASQASQRFQVGDCGSLGFKPKLNLRLKGGTKRGDHPALRAVVRPRVGDANIGRAVVKLPRSAFLDQAHIRTICTRVQFAADQCPQGSIYGSATAVTPLLDGPLTGPAYLRSSDNKLPDLVVALTGPESAPIEVELVGRIDSVRGGIRSTFDSVPDAPVSQFTLEMQGGKKGLIVNSTNLCASTNRALAKLIGQNGKLHEFRPKVVATKCAKRKKSGKHKRRG